MSDVLEIDGSYLEGGGQILRVAVALGCILCRPIRIVKIRAGRADGGLKAQHLTSVQQAARLCDARLEGGALGSTSIGIFPRRLLSGNWDVECGTAGAITLMVQTFAPISLYCPGSVSVRMRGGTDVAFAPPIDYIRYVLAEFLKKMGINLHLSLIRRGFFPRGQGEVEMKIYPIAGPLNPIDVTNRGDIVKFNFYGYSAGSVPFSMLNEMAKVFGSAFGQRYPNVTIDTDLRHLDQREAAFDGGSLVVVAETSTGCCIGSSVLYDRRGNPRIAAQNAVQEFLSTLESGACVDEYMQDQLIVYMGLAGGASRVRVGRITKHTQTAMFVVERICHAKFNVIPDGRSNIIECAGIGHSVLNDVG